MSQRAETVRKLKEEALHVLDVIGPSKLKDICLLTEKSIATMYPVMKDLVFNEEVEYDEENFLYRIKP